MPIQSVLTDPLVAHANAVPPAFDCSWSTDGLDAAWVHLAGELDIATTPRLEQTLRDCLSAARLVVVDLYDLSFMGSCGAGAILDASTRARRDGRRLVLLRPVPDVEFVCALTPGFEDVEIVDLAPARSISQMIVRRASAGEPAHPDAEGAPGALPFADDEGEALAATDCRHAARAFSVAHRIYGDACTEDVAVQAFSMLRDDEASAGPILDRIGPRLLRIARRHARQETDAGREQAPPLPAAVADIYERHAADALASVAPAERRCIELAYLDGPSVSEIAARRGSSIAAANEQLHRGLDGMLGHLRSVAARDAVRGGAPAR